MSSPPRAQGSIPGGAAYPLPGRELHPLEAPGLAWRTEAGLDIRVKDGLGRVLLPKHAEALSQGVRRRAVCPEPIRVGIRAHLRDGLQRQQVKGLHGAVAHRRNTQGPQLAVLLRDVDPPESLGMVAPSLQRPCRRQSLPGRLPQHTIDARGTFPSISSNTTNCPQLREEAMGQEVLQGLHLAPLPLLLSLRDTHLQPPYLTLDGGPVGGTPFCVGGEGTRQLVITRHLRSLLLVVSQT